MGSLAGHGIAGIRSTVVRNRYPRRIGRNARLGHHGTGPTSALVSVTTDTGVTGWGLAGGPLHGLERLVGRAVDELFEPGGDEGGVLEESARPLDCALHDLAGRILGLPVYRMLGGTGVGAAGRGSGGSIPCYDGAIYFDDLDVPTERAIDTVLAECAADRAAGFRAYKLKIGRGYRWMERDAGLSRDIDVVRAVRAAYPGARLLVDANDGLDLPTTLAFLEATADCGLYWLEEPFAENAGDLRRLRAALRGWGSGTLVADGESRPDLDTLLELAADGLVDVLLMDVVSYGLTAWRRIAPRLAEVGTLASPHAWGEPLKTRYAAHLGLGLGGVPVVEGVPGTVDGVDLRRYPLQDGELGVPDEPGFGLEPPAALVP